MISIWLILIIILVIIVIEIVVRNYKHLRHQISPRKEQSRMTPDYILEKIEPYVASVEKNVFIDINCGYGDILRIFYGDFKKIIGIDMNPDITRYLSSQINNSNNSNNSNNIEIINTDPQQYIFPNEDTIIYISEIYEPLYNQNDFTTKKLYRNLFKNITDIFSKNNNKLYIIYCSGLLNKTLDIHFFNDFSFNIVKYDEVPFSKLLPFLHYKLYLLHFNPVVI